ncbi:helix-turn-helix transcriptional regulator [Marinospirillum perlucidum]|uniref:helix-turn-helix transcriptional regulator n=1 Tax=Marinospirillum perlucidum TaxID=1982602 RepID=UPI000DF28096|nr:LuxR C-terminal-related transcriptional regulator [Marinospirillum perlucidum]
MQLADQQAARKGGLLLSKLQPPPLPRDLLERPRLAALLKPASAASITLLTTAPGYGKTLALHSFLNQEQASFTWLDLNADIHKPSSFHGHLLASLIQLTEAPAINEIPALLEDKLSHGDRQDLLTQLLNRLQDLKQPAYLVIDNCHWLQEGETLHLLQSVIDNQPPLLHLFLAGHQAPSLVWSPLKLDDRLTRISAQELALTPEETLQLNRQLNRHSSWAEVADLYQLTLGWPAAIKLSSRDRMQWVQEVLRPAQPADLEKAPTQSTYQELGWQTPEGIHPLLQLRETALDLAPALPSVFLSLAEIPCHKDTLKPLLTAFSLAADKGNLEQIQHLRQLSWLQCQLGQPRAARGYNREAWSLAPQQPASSLQLDLQMDRVLIEIFKGHLQLARQLLQSLDQETLLPDQTIKGFLLQAEIDRLQGQNTRSQQQLQACLLASGHKRPEIFLQALLLLTDLKIRQGEIEEAFALADESEQFLLTLSGETSLWQIALTRLKARLWLQQGKKDLALTWLTQLSRQSGYKSLIPSELYLHLEHLRVLLANKKADTALRLLDQLTSRSHDYPGAPENLALRLHKVVVLQASRQMTPAREELRQALLLAEPEKLLGVFQPLQNELQPLLEDLCEHWAPGSHLHRFTREILGSTSPSPLPSRSLVAPSLSAREQEVLLLVAEGLSNQAIAEQLFISLHTVKSHLKQLMKKLQVKSRTQAVTRARELLLV